MNISELLSDFLKQGKSVDIPGIGSLSAKHVKAHYDADSATFFPSQQLVDFSPLMKGGNEFVHFLAQKDCVSDAIGERTWNNYVEAMKRQLEIDGMLELKGLGTVRKGENGLEFTAAEGLNDGNPLMKAVKNVKQYTAAVNPFARFEHLPEPEPQPIVEEEPPVEDPPLWSKNLLLSRNSPNLCKKRHQPKKYLLKRLLSKKSLSKKSLSKRLPLRQRKHPTRHPVLRPMLPTPSTSI